MVLARIVKDTEKKLSIPRGRRAVHQEHHGPLFFPLVLGNDGGEPDARSRDKTFVVCRKILYTPWATTDGPMQCTPSEKQRQTVARSFPSFAIPLFLARQPPCKEVVP
jgi:hypothetical protein